MHLFAWSYNFKTWTLLNIQASWRMRTSATGVSKATFFLHCKVVQYRKVFCFI